MPRQHLASQWQNKGPPSDNVVTPQVNTRKHRRLERQRRTTSKRHRFDASNTTPTRFMRLICTMPGVSVVMASCWTQPSSDISTQRCSPCKKEFALRTYQADTKCYFFRPVAWEQKKNDRHLCLDLFYS